MSEAKDTGRPVTNGSVPPETRTKGSINNADIGPEVRRPEPVDPKKLDKGPKLDPETGAYGRADYKTARGNIRRDR